MNEPVHGREGSPDGELSQPDAHPSAVLSAFVETIVVGRRVAVFGDATSGLAELFAERGARLVHAYDSERARVAEAVARGTAHRVTHAVLEADLGVRDGAFDVVVVPDLTDTVDPAELIRLARRLLAPAGTLVTAVPNPDVERRLLPWEASEDAEPIGYYELYDLVSMQFSEVRMLGQAPFVGYTIADFAPEGELDITVDTSLLESPEAPEWFIAVGSDRRVDVDAYSVVGLPLAGVASAVAHVIEPSTVRRASRSARAVVADATAERLALTEAQTKLALLGAELDKLRERERESARESRSRGESATRLSSRVVELEGELALSNERLRAVEGFLRSAEARATDAEDRARAAEVRATDAAAHAERAELEAQRARVKLAEDDDRAITQRPPPLDEAPTPPTLDSIVPASEVDGPTLRPPPKAPPPKGPEAAEQVRELERRLAELGAENRSLEDRSAGLRERIATLDKRVQDLERQLRAAEASLAREKGRRVEAERGRAEVSAALEELRRASEQEAAEGPTDDEIKHLEDQLRERGHTIARLQEELREGERIGRELIEQLESSGVFQKMGPAGAPGEPGGGGGSGDEEILRARLSSLAETAAKTEADLTQATWRVAQLQRQVELAERDRPPSVVHAELEEALLAAHQEIAALRTGAGSVHASTLVEQSVLLSQVAGELEKGLSE